MTATLTAAPTSAPQYDEYPRPEFAKLRKLLPEQLAAIYPGQRVYARCYRAFRPTPLLVFEGYAPIAVDIRGGRRGRPETRDLTIVDSEWTEYRVLDAPGFGLDVESDGTLVIEDWFMVLYAEDGGGEPYTPRDDPNRDGFLRWDAESGRECDYCRIDYTQLHSRARYLRGRLVFN